MMYKYLLSTLLAITFILASCTDSTEPSTSPSIRPSISDNAMETGTEAWDAHAEVPCCNETVELTGTVRYAYKEGVAHFNIANLVGIGSSGNVYHGGAVQNENYLEGEGAQHSIYSVKLLMTASGGCQFTLLTKIYYHFDANGRLVVDYYESSSDCKPD